MKPIKEIKDEYPFLSGWGEFHARALYNSILEHQVLNEFLYTVDIDKTIQTLKSRFKSYYKAVGAESVDKGDHTDKNLLIKYSEHQFDYVERINAFLETFGWLPANVSTGEKFSVWTNHKHRQTDDIVIMYEAKNGVKVELGPKSKLYHITPDINYDKIKRIGLTPKTAAKIANHPGRIYLLYKVTKVSDINDLAHALYLKHPNSQMINNMIVLQIDDAVWKNDKDRVFYSDPVFQFSNSDAVYTYQNIAPKYIKEIGKIFVGQEEDDQISIETF